MIFLASCFDEEFVPSSSTDISFSLDTIRFDTVFTEIGSITRSVNIKNLSQENITIDQIKLAQSNSKFRINVDGVPGESFIDIRINALDSVWIFVEVTVDPDEPLSLSPFVISEAIDVVTDGSFMSQIHLEAWGQNANYFPSRDAQGRILGLTCGNGNIFWDDPKPYVIYGLLFIDSCGLTIAPGTQIHVHGGIARVDDQILNDGGLFFLENGSIDVVGTLDEPVVFQGDRLEASFADVPGQWAGIRLLGGSKDNRFSNVIIKNSIIGLRADSASQVLVEQTIIHNTSNAGFIGVNAEAEINNSLFYNNGAQSVLLSSGGRYQVNYVTLANNINDRPAIYMDNFQCLDPNCNKIALRPLTLKVCNSIFTGSNPNEVLIIDATEGSDAELLNISLNQTILKVDESENDFDFASICDGCIINPEGDLFLGEAQSVFSLDTSSVARNAGVPLPQLQIDIIGNLRDAMTPDIGCYEFID